MDKDRGGARWRQRRYFISRLKSRGICHLRARHLFPHPACDGGASPGARATDKRRVSGCVWSELRRLLPAYVCYVEVDDGPKADR